MLVEKAQTLRVSLDLIDNADRFLVYMRKQSRSSLNIEFESVI
jgi:hypothetical protein